MYYHDEPVENFEDDLLGRASFSKLLAQTLFKLKTKHTFTIGLYGKWGSGKTSIVNMALKKLDLLQQEEPEKTIVIHFEPWQFSDSQQLLNQFIIRLANEFASKQDKAMNKIGKALQTYSDAFSLAELIPAVGGTVASIGKFTMGRVGKRLHNDISQKDVLQQKKEVIDLLNKQNAKILVVIDDIDRLSSEQIRQVFQLVASVAKFPNTAYLLVFDKEIVVKALEKVQEGNGEDYLHKIIQMPIQIPEIPESKLHGVLLTNLDKIMVEYKPSFFEDRWKQVYTHCVVPFLSNLRDVNMLLNSLQFKLTTIASEIEFSDMIAISAIEIGAPKIFEWIKSHKNVLVSRSVWGESNRSSSDWIAEYTAEFTPLIDDRIQVTGYAKTKEETIINAISALFPIFAGRVGRSFSSVDNSVARKWCLICNEDKFDRYFNLDIDLVFVSKALIEQIVFLYSRKELEEYILEKDSQGQAHELLEEIRAVLSDVSKERAQELFLALMNAMSLLNPAHDRVFLRSSAYMLAERIAIDSLHLIPENERYAFFVKALNESADVAIESFAYTINVVELAYGRLAAKGQERVELKKSFTETELNLVEQAFVARCKEILARNNMFKLPRWRMTLTLLDAFDKDYTDDYMSKAMEADANVVSYLPFIMSTWVGNGVSYEVNAPPYEYITKARILEAIDNLIESKELFTFEDEIQYQAAAFYLRWNGATGQDWYDGHIPQSKTVEFLESKKREKPVLCVE